MPSFQFKRLDYFDNTELFASANENVYFPFHFHDIFCVSLITNGTEILKNTEQEFIAPTGSISITQLNEVHRNHALSHTGYSYKTIYLNSAVLRHFNKGHEVAALERVIYNKALFQNLLQLFDRPDGNMKLWEESFTALARYATTVQDNNAWVTSFSQMDALIDEHPNHPINTDWLARKFCMSKYHFIRSFKRAKGVTPQTYIMLYRLGKAKKMLLESAPLSDIAYLNGFCDPSHFTNSFKKYFGIPPSLYLNF